MIRTFVVLFLLVCAACDSPPDLDRDVETDVAEIAAVMARQQAAWNRGDIEAFMDDYWKNDSLMFASSGTIKNGWNETLERYKTDYPDRETMGQLTFTLIKTEIFTSERAFVFGRWELERASDKPSGFFSVLFNKVDGSWKITFDHTSSAS